MRCRRLWSTLVRLSQTSFQPPGRCLSWGGRAPGIPRASHPQLGKHTEEDYYRPECAVPVLWIGSSHCFYGLYTLQPGRSALLRFLLRGPLVLFGRDCFGSRERGRGAGLDRAAKQGNSDWTRAPLGVYSAVACDRLILCSNGCPDLRSALFPLFGVRQCRWSLRDGGG